MILNSFLSIIGLCALTIAGTLAQAAAPAAATIVYNLSRNGMMLGTITEQFETRDGRYQATSEAHASGLLALVMREPARYVSSGTVTRDGLRPARFEGHHRGKSLSADFDWAANKLTLLHDGQNRALDLPKGAQDRLSIMYQLMFAMRNKPSLLEVNVTNGRKLSHYRYAVQAEVTIDTPFKQVHAIHLVKQRAPGDGGAEVWIAPEYGNLPVKVVIIEEDGVRYEQVATRVEIRP